MIKFPDWCYKPKAFDVEMVAFLRTAIGAFCFISGGARWLHDGKNFHFLENIQEEKQ